MAGSGSADAAAVSPTRKPVALGIGTRLIREWNLTPQAAIGGARGPVSKTAHIFDSRLHTYFVTHGDEWIPVTDARSKVLAEIGVSDN